ncbi:uncharacterized protein BDZ99DRAFT_202274 [Mytilinidion resinicola]|uniref:Transmembrane protein n=1 Tax=Mytilinidion resinicola TaxID=574789 RepID=A0A6A6Y163_9PEZI|nr:uncharacterized protein BDZ99DRAFT_202274 [Mytilinidion resinicola]KAF2802390.1 hypothetical protein BDZ99DRAFT_202274 [Mytilinidion resinicola]
MLSLTKTPVHISSPSFLPSCLHPTPKPLSLTLLNHPRQTPPPPPSKSPKYSTHHHVTSKHSNSLGRSNLGGKKKSKNQKIVEKPECRPDPRARDSSQTVARRPWLDCAVVGRLRGKIVFRVLLWSLLMCASFLWVSCAGAAVV